MIRGDAMARLLTRSLLVFGIIGGIIGLAACTPQIIFMKDPQTGKVVQCGPDAERTAARECADNYRARGWVETPHASRLDPGGHAPGGVAADRDTNSRV